METIIPLNTTKLFGSDVQYFYHHGRYYFVLSDVLRCMDMTTSRAKSLHKKGQIRLMKQSIYKKRPKSFVINLKNLLILIGFTETQVAIDLNKYLYTKVLPAIAKDGEFIKDKDYYEPTIEFLQSLHK